MRHVVGSRPVVGEPWPTIRCRWKDERALRRREDEQRGQIGQVSATRPRPLGQIREQSPDDDLVAEDQDRIGCDVLDRGALWDRERPEEVWIPGVETAIRGESGQPATLGPVDRAEGTPDIEASVGLEVDRPDPTPSGPLRFTRGVTRPTRDLRRI
jgi:hypothetical protein